VKSLVGDKQTANQNPLKPPAKGKIMRTLQTQEIKSVAGAGIITSTVSTGAAAGKALVGGMISAGTIVAKPLVSLGTSVIKILI
jgi:hypothetical protein